MQTGKKRLINRVISLVLCFSMVMFSAVPAGAESFSSDTDGESGAGGGYGRGKATTGSSITGSGIKAPVSTVAGILYVFEGEGTESNPYIISTEADLRNMAAGINAGIEEYDKKYFEIKEGSDITLTGQWVPIGTEENPFTGYFSGNSQIIRNIKITSSSAIRYLGLFGYNRGAVSDVTVTGAIDSGADYVGGIAGYSEGKIINCTFGLNDESYVKGNNYVGGVAGYAAYIQFGRPNSHNKIKNNGKVEGNEHVGGVYGCVAGNESEISYAELVNMGSVQGNENTGGIIGFAAGSAIFSDSVKLTNKGSVAAEKSNSGGIIGALSDDKFLNKLELQSGAEAVNEGSVGTGGSRAGGIAGFSRNLDFNTNSKAVNNGRVTASESNAGGIAGYLSSQLSTHDSAELTNKGDIETGGDNAGGIAGYSGRGLSATSSSNTTNEGKVTALKSNAGGIVGSSGGTVGVSSGSKMTNEGEITALESNAGGIIGLGSGTADIQFRDSEVVNNGNIKTEGSNGGGIVGSAPLAAFGSDSKVTNRGSVEALSKAGGITGSLTGALNTGGSAGVVNDGSVKALGSNAGGIIGSAENSTFDTYSKITNNGTVEAKLDNAGGIAGSAKRITVRGSAWASNAGRIKAGNNNAGGIAGFCTGDINAAQGFLTNNAAVEASGFNAGGIAGRIEAPEGRSLTVSKAAATGGSVSASGNAGGIAGYARGKLSIGDSYNKAVVFAEDSTAGGIIASASDGTNISVSGSFSYIKDGGTIMETPLTKAAGAVIQNTYYLVGDGFDTEGDSSAKKADEFRYGSIAYIIDKDAAGNRKSLWGQKLGADEAPDHYDGNSEDSGHPMVYKNELQKNPELPDVTVDFDISEGSPYKLYENSVYLNKGGEVKLKVSGLNDEQALLFSPPGFVTLFNGEYKLTGNETDALLTYGMGIRVPEDTSWYRDDPNKETFEINTEAGLLGLAGLVAADGIDFKDKTIRLTGYISLTTSIWDPIGTKDTPFRGSFEVNEKLSIDNFNFTVGESSFGVFGYVEDATVKNLAVNGSVAVTAIGGDNIAGIAANSKNSSFVNCVNNVAATGAAIVGGITGTSRGDTYEGCVNLARLYSSGTKGNAGGIAGVSLGSTFDSCKNQGYVRSAGDAGGIVSQAGSGSSLRDCVNEGTAEGSVSTGGIAGNIPIVLGEKIRLVNCYNSEKGTVKGTGTYAGGVAGIAGNLSVLKNCFNSGSVDTQVANAGGVAGSLAAGAVVERCYNSVKGTVKNKGQYTAGVFGTAGADTKLEEIYNAGTVTGDGDYTAGVFAYGSQGMFGNVKRCYNTGNVEGNGMFAAGICADLRGEKKYSGNQISYLSQCYNLGTVAGTGEDTKAAGITGTNYVNKANSICSYVVDSYNLGNITARNPANAGAISALNWQENENSYYLEGSVQLPEGTKPVDYGSAVALDENAFENGKAAYLLDRGGTAVRKRIWGQGDGYPIPAVPQDNLIYKITLETSGPADGFEGEGDDINKVIYESYAVSKDSAAEIYSSVGKEINLSYNLKAGYLLNTVSAGDRKINAGVDENAKTIKLYFTEETDLRIDVNFIKAPEPLMPDYTVIYDANGGHWAQVITKMPQKVKGGFRAREPVPPPSNDSLPGVKQKLTGWYSDPECTKTYDFTAAVISDITLYAAWVPVAQHDVVFDASGGTFGDTGLITVKVDDGEKAVKPEPGPIRDGYDFRGWYTDEGCLYPYDFNRPVTAGFRLYAGWAEKGTCVVVFNGNGGMVESGGKYADAVAVTVAEGEKISSLKAEREDEGTSTFTFKGWYTQDGEEWDFHDPVERSMALTAQWEENFFQVPGKYEIDSLEALETLRDEVNEGNTYEGSVFTLTEHIRLPEDWVSIGFISTPTSGNWGDGFRGTFDGNGRTITIDNYQSMPVFGVLGYEGVIENVNIKGDHVYNIPVPLVMSSHGEISNVNVSGEFYRCAAGIALEAYTGSIERCTVKQGSVIDGDGAVGGILALSRSGGQDGPVKIKRCTVEPGTKISARDGDDIVQSLGGIVAYSYGTVEDCINAADLTANYSGFEGIAGGIAGTTNSQGDLGIERCANTGNITVTGGSAGGIAGSASKYGSSVGINYCYSTGNIKATGDVRYIGGIGGAASGIDNSYWYGEFLSVPEGTEGVGAITGYDGGSLSVKNCYYGVKASGSYESRETISDKYDGRGSTKMTAEDFEIGRVAYLIDGGEEEHENKWTQDFETGRYDDFEEVQHPVLGEPSVYMITINSIGKGHIEINGLKDTAFWGSGKTVSIESFPDEGTGTEEYKLDKISVSDSEGKHIDCSIEELKFQMDEGNVTVTAEFAAQEKARITPKVTGFSGGVDMAIGDAESGEDYFADIGDTVMVTVSVLPHPEVKGAVSAEYFLKSLTVRFEGGEPIDIAGSRQFTAMGNAVVTADIGENIVYPSDDPDKPKPQKPDNDDDDVTPPYVKEIEGGGTGDGDGIGDGTGAGIGEGTGGGTDSSLEGNQGGTSDTGAGSPVEDSDEKGNASVAVKSPEQPENREVIAAEAKPAEKPEEEQTPPEPEEEEKNEPEKPEEPEEESSTVFKKIQDNIRKNPAIAVMVVLVILLINGIIAFIRFRKLKK